MHEKEICLVHACVSTERQHVKAYRTVPCDAMFTNATCSLCFTVNGLMNPLISKLGGLTRKLKWQSHSSNFWSGYPGVIF